MKAESNLLTEKQSNMEENLEEVCCHTDDLVAEKILSTDVKQNLLPCVKEISCVDFEMPPMVSQPSTSQVSSSHNCFQEIDRALGPGPADEVLSTGYHISLNRCDFQLLNNGKWLNDKVS